MRSVKHVVKPMGPSDGLGMGIMTEFDDDGAFKPPQQLASIRLVRTSTNNGNEKSRVCQKNGNGKKKLEL